MIQPKKILIILLLVACFAEARPALNFAQDESSELTDFVCEVGINFYKKGRFPEALREFQTVLIIDPYNETAKRYIDLIESQTAAAIVVTSSEEKKLPIQKPVEEIFPVERIFPEAKKEKSMADFVRKMEKEIKGEVYVSEEEAQAKKAAGLGQEALPQSLILDDQISNLKFPLEIEQSRSVIIGGKSISRFLITQPEVLIAERINGDEVKFTGGELGYTYLHIWDQNQRWTLEFLTVPLRPQGATLEEEMRRGEETAKNIRLRYAFDWSVFETGRRVSSLKRSSYSMNHSFGLVGNPETPYGNITSNLSLSVSKDQSAKLTNFSLGLANGHIGPFKGFNLYTFDFIPLISNRAFSSVNLRGVMFDSPAFNEQIKYTVFRGRESKGRYIGLSPLMAEMKNSYLSGLDVMYLPKGSQNYEFGVFHGWGSERAADLNDYGYDFKINSLFEKWNWKYEAGYDSEKFAHLLKTGFKLPKGTLTNELRDVDKTFKTMSGLGASVGEVGVLTNVNYVPYENLDLSAKLDVFKDRLYPNPENTGRLNEDLDLNANLRINPLTSLNSNLGYQDYLGRISASRVYSGGIGLNRAFEWIRKINTNINYRYNLNKYQNSPAQDSANNKILMGLRVYLIGKLNYFVNEELNWVNALNANETATPRAFETGVDWNDQIFDSPFSANFRFMYRDEENTASPFSFMAGEDYIETSAELNYKPAAEVEAFVNTRVRNVWAENIEVRKHLDLSFYSGLRYIWDTGLRWESVGAIEGYVFKDLNSDGLRQRDEAPMQGVKVWLGKDKSLVTDLFGYYKFTKVKANKAYVNIDTTTIPTGFVLTVPQTQEVKIVNWQTVQVNFGVLSRTELIGLVFEDVDWDGEYDINDSGIKGVVLKLDNGLEAVTDDYGRYCFDKDVIGKHTVTLDLSNLPAAYIPSVPIFREVELSEGMSYSYNIPVKKMER